MKALRFKAWALMWLMILAWSALAGGGSPQAAGVEPDRLKAILADFERYAERTRQSWEVPGLAAAVVFEDEVVYARGFGLKEVGGEDPVDVRTVFQIGSASKAFTAALAAAMVDEGKFRWTDKVVDHLPDFQMYDPWVTRQFEVEDLMAQHSGLPAYAGDFQTVVGFDREHVIHSLRYLKPISSFRSRFAYVNNLFLVAAALMERRSGRSWEESLKARLFEPLGMSESTAGLESFRRTPNLAIPHARMNDHVAPLKKDWPFHLAFYTYGPAGGINSNVLDMARWLRLNLKKGLFEGRRLISAANLDYVHAPKTIVAVGEAGRQAGVSRPLMGEGVFYALGWMYVYGRPDDIIWHNGGTTGCKSVVAFVPSAGLGIVVLSNLGGTLVPEILAQWFFDRFFGAADKDWSEVVLDKAREEKKKAAAGAPQKPSSPSPSLPLSAYAGAYANEVYGEVSVSAGPEGLVLTLGPGRVKVHLRHVDRDVFSCLVPELPGDLGLARFYVNAAQKAETLILEELNTAGDGLFKRLTK